MLPVNVQLQLHEVDSLTIHNAPNGPLGLFHCALWARTLFHDGIMQVWKGHHTLLLGNQKCVRHNHKALSLQLDCHNIRADV